MRPGAVAAEDQTLTWGVVSFVLTKLRSGGDVGFDDVDEGDGVGVAAAAVAGSGNRLERATVAPANALNTAIPAPSMK
jgi:hypothetical protein